MSQFTTLMPIRTRGDGPALFCVHGEPLRVAQRIRADRPVYGLSHIYHSDFLAEPPASIEDLAATYLAEVRQVQANGPYHICGFSAGGMIAFEMAQQLIAAGEELADLTLVEPTMLSDSFTVSERVADSFRQADNKIQVILHWLRRLPASVRARTQTALVALRARVMLATNRQLPEDLRWYGYLKSLGPAMRAYRYRPLNCRASFLYGSMDDDTFKIWKDCWEALVPGGAEIKSFENIHDHNEFMVDPGMTYLVEYLERDSKPG